MTPMKLTLATALAGIAAILALGSLQTLEPKVRELRQAAEVTAPQVRGILSDDNLADAVASLTLNHRIGKVGWDHSILTLDLTLKENAGGAASLWRDMAEVLRFSFLDAVNVRQTLVRVYRQTEGRRVLLFYGDPRREEWPRSRLENAVEPKRLTEEAFRSGIGLTSTPAGARWLRNLAN
ncbi:hypothetical protein [Cohnella candidum]|uniref:DUF4825 domain-containing protein n=1 Tax=Cohnella candidum TaxID=2674991 RepID=A0A3G3JWV7_9BACL|nr:hypothetical protein [Cohnella candidum]AYQ72722.1 hypothetical protein EAV92_09190 [Cohnella candidum]